MKKILIFAVLFSLPLMAQEEEYRPSQSLWDESGSFEMAENIRAARVPTTIAEAVAALPALPTIEQISSAKAKAQVFASTYEPYTLAIQQFMLRAQNEQAILSARVDALRREQAQRQHGTMQQYSANVQAGLMPSQQEMMALYMSGEINESMSDAQMMDVMAGKFAAKWGVSKEEYLKIIHMAQQNERAAATYLQTNHPQLYQRLYGANASFGTQNVEKEDPRDGRFTQINGELEQLQEQLLKAISSYGGADLYVASHGGSAYDKQKDKMRAEWPKSSEAAQIDAIEKALWIRVEAWMSAQNVPDGFVPYPGWWTDERKKENALINQWNRRQAQEWLKVAQEGESALKGVYQKIAALETENEELGKQGGENMLYLMNKQRLFTMYGELLQLIKPYTEALGFPCIEHVEETGSALFGKG